MTQVGYTEGPDNDTKYGDWLGFPNAPWCASFISWCAEQAEISPAILQRTALANPGRNPGFGIPCYHGSEYTPKRGDLFFKEDFSHVGIVYGLEGDEVLTIEANTNDDGSDEGYAVLLRRRKIAECYFGVPSYKGTDKAHTYVRKSDPGHPHPAYYQCTTCGHLYYTLTPTHQTDCRYCMSCGCSTAVEGYYKVSAMDDRLVVYSVEAPKPKKEYSTRKGYLDPDELVYVVAGDRDWGHIIYANSVGYVKMKYLQKFIPSPTDVTVSSSAFYEGDTANIYWSQVHTATDYMVTVYQNGQQLLSRNTTGDTAFTLPELSYGHYRVEVQAGDGTTLWTCTHSRDFAVAFAGLMGNAHALGETYHITSDESMTWNQIYQTIANVLGVKLNAIHIASETLATLSPDWVGALLGDKSNTVVFDNTKIKRAVPQFCATTRYDQGIREAIAYIEAHPECQKLDPEFDAWCDAVAEAYQKLAAALPKL